ncbi:rho GTPase-activating protein 32-like [Coturnix japonica]|uniref:rho GTPase-activating protein 32-like n=1 Tax=Coturnix japonica TaxID=93934 RepID=UPI0013A5C792|nr:rho GTPase-activating protein 32-like [Coturnix japonica]
MMKSSLHSEEDDFVPELQRSIHPRERPDWEETLSAMARGADIPDITGELPLRTCGSTASMKVKNVKKYINPGLMGCDAFHRLSFTKGHFPKMAECAHFHYENVDFGNIQELKNLQSKPDDLLWDVFLRCETSCSHLKFVLLKYFVSHKELLWGACLDPHPSAQSPIGCSSG